MRKYFTISGVRLVGMKTYCLLLFSIVALLGVVSCEKYNKIQYPLERFNYDSGENTFTFDAPDFISRVHFHTWEGDEDLYEKPGQEGVKKGHVFVNGAPTNLHGEGTWYSVDTTIDTPPQLIVKMQANTGENPRHIRLYVVLCRRDSWGRDDFRFHGNTYEFLLSQAAGGSTEN